MNHIFQSSGELYLINQVLPSKPDPESDHYAIHFGGEWHHAYSYAIADGLYSEAIERLKKEAIRVEGLGFSIGGDIGFDEPVIKPIIKNPKEGELYPIEAEVEIKVEACDRDYCWIHERCEFDYDNDGSIKSCGSKKVAILRLKQEPESSEDDREQFAIEFFDYMENERWKYDHHEQRTHTVKEHLEYFKQIRK